MLDGQARGVLDPLDQVAAQPARADVAGWVETMISSGRRSATASIVARNGSASPTSPLASMPSAATAAEREVDAHLRRFADRLVVDHEARRGLALGHDQAKARAARSAACARARPRAASRRRACGWRRPGFPSSRRARRPHWLAPASRRSGRRRPSPARARARRCRAPRPARRTRRGRRRRSGTRSKLNTGGGEETCHSSVIPRHGLATRARAAAPAGDDVVDEDQRAQARGRSSRSR